MWKWIFDLSEVMFVTTANTLDIPPPLMDRLEIVNLSGYTENERINIARDHLIPRQFKENGLENKEAQITESAVRGMIRYYTREAGVRALDRCISKVCRKIVLDIDRTADDSARAKKRRAKTKIAKIAKKQTSPKMSYAFADGGCRLRRWTNISVRANTVSAYRRRTTKSDKSPDSYGRRPAAICFP